MRTFHLPSQNAIDAAIDTIQEWKADPDTVTPLQVYRVAQLLPHISLPEVWDSLDFQDFLVESMVTCHDYGFGLKLAEYCSFDWKLQHVEQIASQPSEYQLDLLDAILRNVTDWETFLPMIHAVRDNCWDQFVSFLNDHRADWREIAASRFPDQQEYLRSLLFHDHGDEKMASSSWQNSTLETSMRQRVETQSPKEPQNSWKTRIDKVKELLPELGDGFIDMVLSYYKGNVSQVITACLEDSLPPQLAHVDRKLPRRQKTGATGTEDVESRRVLKNSLASQQHKEETESALFHRALSRKNEYDDDYDDQYDDTEGFASNVDITLYDDYEAIRAYNKTMKEEEAEQHFWEESRNTNRDQNPKKKGGFGPDKVRGGRLPGRGGTKSQKETKRDGKSSAAVKPTEPDTKGRGRGAARAKQRRLAKRRDQQKAAASR